MLVPEKMSWLFWELDPPSPDAEQHADYILARILEFGGLAEVRWALQTYGPERVHHFFKDIGHPELSERTIKFWRAYFKDKQPWASPPAWRSHSSAPWID